jgi:hypothetical protein
LVVGTKLGTKKRAKLIPPAPPLVMLVSDPAPGPRSRGRGPVPAYPHAVACGRPRSIDTESFHRVDRFALQSTPQVGMGQFVAPQGPRQSRRSTRLAGPMIVG